LLVTIFCWQPSDLVVWRWPAPLDAVVSWAFIASWGGLLYSLHLTGLGWQTGWTPWWHWFRRLPAPKRAFVERGAYRFLRHPVYLAFLGLVWFVPVVTVDRVVLIACWTAYISIGSVLKDRRLVRFLGDDYRAYQARVPGYPGIPFGPLARLP
jgi:protein-S-isoprenylcysteine O-methyltransferase Ste14